MKIAIIGAGRVDAVQDADVVVLDTDAKPAVSGQAASLGYRPTISSSLRMARSLEEMAFLNISRNASKGRAWQSGWTLVGPTTSA